MKLKLNELVIVQAMFLPDGAGSNRFIFRIYIFKGWGRIDLRVQRSGAARDMAGKTVNEGANFMLSYMGPDQL